VKKVLLALLPVLLFALPSLAQVSSYPSGPEGDFGFGVGTLIAPSSSSASGNYSPQTIGGGAYLDFDTNFLIHHNFGAGFDIAWRASQNLYQGYQGFRPILYDFHGIYAPPLGKHAQLELLGGIGGLTTRFYSDVYQCSFVSCTNYADSNHFMGDVGAGVRIYVKGNVFLRPEVRQYFIHNNYEFSSPYATRADVTLGYAFGRQ
jgi:hypothetical protein